MTPRLGFLGLGWIGLHRMKAVAASRLAQVVAVADANPDAVSAAQQAVPQAAAATSLQDLLRHDLDGLVIATPSALHADQCLQALQAGLAVFCQKPLARTADEARRVVEAAHRADRLLGVDLSYRRTKGMAVMHDLVTSGELGRIYTLRLTFHNAYGPDKPWFYDRRLSGGGCAMDLGIHLVDLALWLTGFPEVEGVDARLFQGGRPLAGDEVDDYCTARLDLAGGRVAEISCSWNLPAGQDCAIEVLAYGDRGGVVFRNRNGSFYDFEVRRLHKTWSDLLVEPPDDWGGRTIVEWARRLGAGASFDPAAEESVRVAEVLDRLYAREAEGIPCGS